ncbi:MAG: hypothetical protein FJ395_00435 [Verrucomicrobia bacterium]|nr:hypothetical protein [Verrucomicrobiota bacterium]
MKSSLILLAVAMALAGCETPSGRPDRTATGALLGGALGAATGAIIGGTGNRAGAGAAIGGALGAVTGGIIGHAMDQQQRERLHRQSPGTLARVDQRQPLGLADIKALAKAGISEEVIISQIRASRTVYRLTTAEIIELRDAGVSNRVIDFMINTPNAANLPLPATVEQPTAVTVTEPPPPPPPLQEEVIARPRRGYVWIPGAWTWYGGRWVWVSGRWALPPHRRAVWVPGRYERRGGTVVWFSGHWR